MRWLRWLWRETPIPSVVMLVGTVGAVGYLMATGNGRVEVTFSQATALVPILLMLLVLVGQPLSRWWIETRAVKEIRRNQQRRGESVSQDQVREEQGLPPLTAPRPSTRVRKKTA